MRDVVIYALATAIVVVQLYRNLETGEPPNLSWLGVAAFFFGLVPAIRIDQWLFRENGKNGKNGNGGNGQGSSA